MFRERKFAKRVVMIFVTIILVTVVAKTWVYNDRVTSIAAPKWMSVMVTAFFPPRDLYDFLVRSSIDISQAGTKEVRFRAKYRGRHDVGILLSNFDPDKFYGAQYTFPLRLKLTFLQGPIPILSKVVGASSSPFIGKGASGFGLLIFHVPDDLPIEEEITCKIEVVSPDAVLNGGYGPAEFYVRKISDK